MTNPGELRQFGRICTAIAGSAGRLGFEEVSRDLAEELGGIRYHLLSRAHVPLFTGTTRRGSDAVHPNSTAEVLKEGMQKEEAALVRPCPLDYDDLQIALFAYRTTTGLEVGEALRVQEGRVARLRGLEGGLGDIGDTTQRLFKKRGCRRLFRVYDGLQGRGVEIFDAVGTRENDLVFGYHKREVEPGQGTEGTIYRFDKQGGLREMVSFRRKSNDPVHGVTVTAVPQGRGATYGQKATAAKIELASRLRSMN